MKKAFGLILCGVMLVSITGCGNNQQNSNPSSSDNLEEQEINYKIGGAIYFNPETASSCQKQDVEYSIDDLDKGREEENTKTGCMRWYVIDNSDTETLDLILDHRTTYYTVYSDIESKLKNDTITWNSSLNPRLITVEEIIIATEQKLDFDGVSSFRFENVDDNNVLQDNFAWLYDGYYTSNNGKTTFGYLTLIHI